MATRKATTRRTSSKTPARKRPARKGTAKRKAATKPRAAGPKRKATARARPKTATPDAIARKIVRMTKDHSKFNLEDLYAENCVSYEPNQAEPALGHEGLRAKNEFWDGFQDSSKADWNAKNIFIKGNTICIEWDANIVTREGRSLRLQEVAIHEVKGGKIVAERFYFDSSALQPAAAPATPKPSSGGETRYTQQSQPTITPEVSSRPSYSSLDSDDDPPTPKVDPIDL